MDNNRHHSHRHNNHHHQQQQQQHHDYHYQDHPHQHHQQQHQFHRRSISPDFYSHPHDGAQDKAHYHHPHPNYAAAAPISPTASSTTSDDRRRQSSSSSSNHHRANHSLDYSSIVNTMTHPTDASTFAMPYTHSSSHGQHHYDQDGHQDHQDQDEQDYHYHQQQQRQQQQQQQHDQYHSNSDNIINNHHHRHTHGGHHNNASSPPTTTSAPSSPTASEPMPKKVKRRNPSTKCPLCHEVIPTAQYQQHYRQELARLDTVTLTNHGSRGKRGAAIAATKSFTKGKTRTSGLDQERQRTLEDIRKRRTARTKEQSGHGPTTGHGSSGGGVRAGGNTHARSATEGGAGTGAVGDGDAPAVCFICNERLFGSLDDINAHIDGCLSNPPAGSSSGRAASPLSAQQSSPNSRRMANGSGVSSNNATPGGTARFDPESFEEYTWAGQTRVRATVLFEGGMSALGSGSGSRGQPQVDVDDDLNVDDDDDEEYGTIQFTERDVVPEAMNDADGELREMVLESSSSSAMFRPQMHGVDGEVDGDATETDNDATETDREQGSDTESEEEIDIEQDDPAANLESAIQLAYASKDIQLVLKALKDKIKHLEAMTRNSPMCLICLEPYTMPLTSIVCWHVHCEQCWFRTLGTKKLCPQCQKITLPKDLRRIYL